MRYEIAAMVFAVGGAIVNIASILGSVGFAQSAAYVAAKHGVLGLTKAAALEYAAHGIRVTAVGPGFVDTPLLSKNPDEATLQHFAGLHPIGCLAAPKKLLPSRAYCFRSERLSLPAATTWWMAAM